MANCFQSPNKVIMNNVVLVYLRKCRSRHDNDMKNGSFLFVFKLLFMWQLYTHNLFLCLFKLKFFIHTYKYNSTLKTQINQVEHFWNIISFLHPSPFQTIKHATWINTIFVRRFEATARIILNIIIKWQQSWDI